MGTIYQQHDKAARKFQRKLGKVLLWLLPVIGLCWVVDIWLEWQYILAIISSSFYGFFVIFYVILRMINK